MNLSSFKVGFWQSRSGHSRLHLSLVTGCAVAVLCLSLTRESRAAEPLNSNSKGAAQTQAQTTMDKPQKIGAAVDPAMRAIFGVGTDQNYGLALKHLNRVIATDSKASREDQALAKAWLGILYYNGWGTKTDTIRALVLVSEALSQLTRSSDAGHSIAQMTLGRLYRNGLGVPEDLPLARDLLQRAASQGSAAANLYLGYMEQKGLGGDIDLKKAQNHYARSAAAGNSFGAYYLSLAYAEGWSGTVDSKSSKIWLDRAVKRKNPEALRAVENNAKPSPVANRSDQKPNDQKPNKSGEKIIEISPKKYANVNLNQSNDRAAATRTAAKTPAKTAAASTLVEPSKRKPITNAARKSFEVATAETIPEARPEARPTVKPLAAVTSASAVGASAVGASDVAMADAPAVRAQAAAGEDINSLIRRSDRGEVDAKLTLARAYLVGDRVQQDDRRAASLYNQLAEAGNAEAQNALGVLYGTGRGVELSYQLATGWYRQSAGQNYPPALFNLAVMVENGWGGETPPGQAGQYYLKSAELGYGQAQWLMSSAYATGKYVVADPAESAKWLRRAAESGVAQAQYQFGAERLAQAVSDAEEDNALAWIRRASLQGQAEARLEIQQRDLAARGSSLEQFRLGSRYYTGDRVPRKAGKAMTWWRQSAMNGSGSATVSLARLYASGEMGQADLYKSAACLFIAERLKVDDVKLKEYLLPRLSKSELEQAQVFADNWKIGVAVP